MKVPDPIIFFFSSINPDEQGISKRSANTIFRPLQASTMMGREYRESTECVYKVRPINETNLLDKFLFLPCLLLSPLGIILKYFAFSIDPRMRMDEAGVRDFILMTDPPKSPLQDAHIETLNFAKVFLTSIARVSEEEAQKAWTSPEMKALISQLNTLIAKEAELLVQAFNKEDKETWKNILEQKNCSPNHTKTYASKFFFLTQLYFIVRKRTYYDVSGETFELEEKNRALFFQKETPQYQLRLTFNNFMTEMEPICSTMGGDARFHTTLRLDNDSAQEPQEFSYPTTPIRWELIEQKEIREILAHKK